MSKQKTAKKALVLGLAGAMLGQAMMPMSLPVYAQESSAIELHLNQNKEIDVVLTVGHSTVDVANFEKDLTDKLASMGLNRSNIRVSAIETATVSTDDADASQIFNQWENYPNAVGQWQLTNVGGEQVIRSTVNTQWTGFWKEEDVRNATFDFTTGVTQATDDDWIGFTFRMNRYAPGDPRNPYSGNYDAYDMYFFAINGGGTGSIHHSGLYKLEKAPFTNNQVGQHTMWTGTWTQGNWNQRAIYFTQSGTNVPQQVDTTPGTAFPASAKGSMIPLQRTNTANLLWMPYNSWRDVKIDVNGNNIKVWVNGKLEIDFTDNNNPIMTGGYGPFAASQAYGTFKDITISTESTRNFSEVIREPAWRDTAERFIVNLDDNKVADFDNQQALGEILTRLGNEEIHYIGWGSNDNKNQAENFIAQNNNNGIFVNNSNYQNSINAIAQYIADQVITAPVSPMNPYILAGEPLTIEVNPVELRQNTATVNFPNGRWRLDHDHEYFDNSMGQYSLSHQYQDSLPVQLDRPGKYTIWFGDDHPDLTHLLVHRRPVANFQAQVTGHASGATVNIIDHSFDLDLQSQPDRGIAQHQWRWKEVSDTSWTNGMIPTELPLHKNYIAELTVKDHQGAWSQPLSVFITTEDVVSTPIANFTLERSRIFVGQTLQIGDISYDPAGRAITQREWTVQKNGNTVYQGATMPSSLDSYGAGNFSIRLRVRNDQNMWSESYVRNVTLEEDKIAPEVINNNTNYSWSSTDVSATLRFFDEGGSGFDAQRYAVTSTQAAPTTGWSQWNGEDEIGFTFSEDGEHYLHVEARDGSGNLMKRTFGPYRIDKTPPQAPIFTQNEFSFDVTPGYSLSGTDKVMVKVGDENWTDTFSHTNHQYGEYEVSVKTVSYTGVESPVVTQTIFIGTVYAQLHDDLRSMEEEVETLNGWSYDDNPLKEARQAHTAKVEELNALPAGESFDYVKITADAIDSKIQEEEEKHIELMGKVDETYSAIDHVSITLDLDDYYLVHALLDALPEGSVKDELVDLTMAVEHSVIMHIHEHTMENIDNLPSYEYIFQLEDLVANMPDSQQKTELEQVISTVMKQLDEEFKAVRRLIERIEQTLNPTEYEQARQMNNGMPESPQKDGFSERLDVVYRLIKEHQATVAVDLAVSLKRDHHVQNAREQVEALHEGTVKTTLMSRMSIFDQQMADKTAVDQSEKIAQAMNMAEQYQREPYIGNARTLVESMPDSSQKTVYLERLVELKEIDVMKAVERAMRLKSESAANDAEALIQELPNGEFKTMLLGIIELLREEMRGGDFDPQEIFFRRVERLTQMAELLKREPHIQIAQTYANMVQDPTGRQHLTLRIEAISMPSAEQTAIAQAIEVVERAEANPLSFLVRQAENVVNALSASEHKTWLQGRVQALK